MIKEYDGDLQAYEYQLVSKSRLHEQIDQIISIFEKRQPNNEHLQEQKKLRVLELKNIINKIICRFKSMQDDPQRFGKMQNMLHILGFEVKLLKILQQNHLQGDELILVYRIVQFMEFFSKDNPRHSRALEQHFPTFLAISCPRINISKLAAQMVALNRDAGLLRRNFAQLLQAFVTNFRFLLATGRGHLTKEERRDIHAKVARASDYLRVVVAFLCAEGVHFVPSLKTQFLDTVLRVANELRLFNFDFFERVLLISRVARNKDKTVISKVEPDAPGDDRRPEETLRAEKSLFCQQELLLGLLVALSLCTRHERNRHMLVRFLSIREHFRRQYGSIRDQEPRKKKLSPVQPQPKTDYTALFYMVH